MQDINTPLEQAETLPSKFYLDPQYWDQMKEAIFAKSWLWVADKIQLFKGPENVFPIQLLDGYLDEPLLIVEDENEEIKCLSNVCTHRGFLLLQHPVKRAKITCGYHGRRFRLDGHMEFMPQFSTAENFPRPCDHLHQIPLKNWHRFLFANLDPAIDFERIFSKLDERLGFMPLDSFTHRPDLAKTYHVHAHWALYIDNYLEGFHIPFVHNALNAMIDYGAYTTEVYDHMVLQIGYADGGGETFDLPEGHPDFGKEVTAYYYWVFPNFMLNFYPWGVQINVIKPVTPKLTRVFFDWYIYDEELLETMQGSQIAEKTEREDEFVVEAVQKGLKSRFYDTGRYSPEMEGGVYSFHQLIRQYMKL